MITEGIKLDEADRLELKSKVPQHGNRYFGAAVAFANGLDGSAVFVIDDKALDVVKLQKMGLLRHIGPVRGGHWEFLVRDGNDINAREA